MTTFLALFRGATVGEEKLISVSADPNREAHAASRLVKIGYDELIDSKDAIWDADTEGRKNAPKLIVSNACSNRTEGDGE